MGANMLIFYQIGVKECRPDVHCNVVDAFNNMLACYKVRVE